MEGLELPTPYDDIVLPNAWDVENKTPFINIDSSGSKVSYKGKMNTVMDIHRNILKFRIDER